MNYMNDKALGLPSRRNFTFFSINALNMMSTTLRLLPQRCFPYLLKWYDLSPAERVELLLERIEFLCESDFLADIVDQWRTSPLGMDRHGRIYWVFYFSSFVYVETKDKWHYISNMNEIKSLITALDERHADEYRLKMALIEEKDSLSQMLTEWADAMARQVEDTDDEPVKRYTRKRYKEENDDKIEASKTMDDILVEEINHVAKRLYSGQLGLEDDKETIECLVDSAISNLDTMKETIVRFISAIPLENLNDHLWNGKEFPKFVEVSQPQNVKILILLRNLTRLRTLSSCAFTGPCSTIKSSGRSLISERKSFAQVAPRPVPPEKRSTTQSQRMTIREGKGRPHLKRKRPPYCKYSLIFMSNSNSYRYSSVQHSRHIKTL